jgi:CRISPR-associated protein Csb2
MTAYFCITVRFLQPFCHARGEGEEPEWPPSPLRLFQALVAAAAGRWNERTEVASAKDALHWLEQQEAPRILAPRGTPASATYRLYVPDNVGDKVAVSWCRDKTGTIADYRTEMAKAKNLVEKDVRPTCLQGEAVHYLYSIKQGDGQFASYRETLVATARSMTHLGWGIDMVVGNATVLSPEEVEKLPGERWQATKGPALGGLRVPVMGTLSALCKRHKAFLGKFGTNPNYPSPVPPLSPGTAFRVVGYRRVADPPPRHRAAFRLLHPTEDRSAVFAQTRANHVAAMTRNAMARIAAEQGQPQEWINRYVHGHRRQGEEESLPRFSYLPLPTIEPRGREGEVLGAIRRLLVAELVDSEESDLRWARQMLPGQFLTDDKTGERKAMLAPLSREDWVLQRYVGRSDIWATVTPVVLPGSDDGKWAKAEKLFFKALRHAGYSPDALAELEFRNVSFWPGGDWALQFQRPDYLKEACWSVYHVRLRWKQEVAGPIALGAGRHCGLGTFAIFQVGSR